MPFGTIWGIKHLNMNVGHFCTSLSPLFDMYILNMSIKSNKFNRFLFGTNCNFPKIFQNKAKINNFGYIFGPNLLSKMAQK